MTTLTTPQRPRVMRWRLIDVLIAGVAVILILVGVLRLSAADTGLTREAVELPEAPLTVARPAYARQAPTVVIAHGFSGSRQMMQPFAMTLARNGYVTINFDFPGHGANPRPLEGEIGEPRRAQILLEALTAVVDYATGLPHYDGRLALLGHSMGGDIAVRYARSAAGPEGSAPSGDPEAGASAGSGPQPDHAVVRGAAGNVDALVAVSPYLSEEIGAFRPGNSPENLLFIYGEWEPAMIHQQGREAVAAVAGIASEAVETDVTYGEHAGGSARRLVIADSVEHIGVLYSQQALESTLRWLNQVFDHPGSGWIDGRGLWLGIYFLGVILLARPLARLLPRVSAEPLGAGLGWRQLLPAAILPAVLTPLILRPFPSDFLSIALADYIALHFAVYAMLSGAAMLLLSRGRAGKQSKTSLSAFVIALIAVVSYQALTIALPTDWYVAAFLPDPHRGLILTVLFAATALWFGVDEWLTRGAGAARGAYALTKAMFLLSLMLAVALDLEQLFFLVIIIPAVLILFVVFGLFSGWIYRQTGHPLVAALANALALAAAITASFPIAG